jgi:hypothetical protein
MNMSDLSVAVMQYNRSCAANKDSDAWNDYATSCFILYQGADADLSREAPPAIAEYWLRVVAGKSTDYDPKTGSRRVQP